MATNKIIWNRPVLDFELRNRGGTVGRWLTGMGREITTAAKLQAGVKTGALKASIHMEHSRNPLGQEIRVGSNNIKYATMHHEGTKPHIIVPNRAPQLVFMSAKSGRPRIIRTTLVHHPGTKANPYLTIPMRTVLAAHGVI